MPAITDMVARYSGTVAFTDNTKEYFHCQMEGDRMWSVDTTGSHSAQGKICWYDSTSYPYYWKQILSWDGLPFVYVDEIDTNEVVVNKIINDMVIRGEITFSLDDGSVYPASFSWDRKGGYVWVTPGNLNVTNLSAYLTKLETMLGQIFDIAILV